jgi:hydroxyacylglutathione hydrolase
LREPASIEVPGIGEVFQVISVPGHTRGHLAYYGANLLLCGDTLFGCGCGRLFEGTAEQMWHSLARLAALPGDTLVYCAHEYTEANIDFARVVEPGNLALLERERRVGALRERGLPSVPSTLDEERLTNPFLRSAEPEVIASARRFAGRDLDGPTAVFAAVREWKNGF